MSLEGEEPSESEEEGSEKRMRELRYSQSLRGFGVTLMILSAS